MPRCVNAQGISAATGSQTSMLSPKGSAAAGNTPTIVEGRSFSPTVRPMTFGSRPNCRFHIRSLIAATRGASSRLSPASNSRPLSAVTPSVVKKSGSTTLPVSRCGSPEPLRSTSQVRANTVIDVSVRLRARQSSASGTETSLPLVSTASCSASGYGRGRSRTPCTMLKTAVFAPMPRANVAMAVRAKVGRRASERAASRHSRRGLIIRSLGRGSARRHSGQLAYHQAGAQTSHSARRSGRLLAASISVVSRYGIRRTTFGHDPRHDP